jgi:hypothetical protein
VLPILLLTTLLAPPAARSAPPGRMPRLPRNVPPRTAPPLPVAVFLTARTSGGEVRVSAPPPPADSGARPQLTLRSGEKPDIRWTVRNTHPRSKIMNLAVHFLIKREQAEGERVPSGPPQPEYYADTLIGTDLSAKGSTTGSFNTAIYEPGVYLVEVELLDPQGNRRQFCVLEIKVVQP